MKIFVFSLSTIRGVYHTDESFTIWNLSVNGIDVTKKGCRQELFKSILQYNGFDLVGESIERNVTKAHLGQAIHDMTQLLINVYNFFQLSPHNVKSQFLDDVKHYFMQNENYSVFLAFSIAGKSRLEHRFNFCIHEQRLFKDSASSQ